MKQLNKIVTLVAAVMVFSVYAGETSASPASNKNTTSLKTTVNTESKYTAVKTDTASKNIIPMKTNWSKIKDLFM